MPICLAVSAVGLAVFRPFRITLFVSPLDLLQRIQSLFVIMCTARPFCWECMEHCLRCPLHKLSTRLQVAVLRLALTARREAQQLLRKARKRKACGAADASVQPAGAADLLAAAPALPESAAGPAGHDRAAVRQPHIAVEALAPLSRAAASVRESAAALARPGRETVEQPRAAAEALAAPVGAAAVVRESAVALARPG